MQTFVLDVTPVVLVSINFIAYLKERGSEQVFAVTEAISDYEANTVDSNHVSILRIGANTAIEDDVDVGGRLQDTY